MNLEKNLLIPRSKWPSALQGCTEDEISVIYTPWTDHEVKIPENYQVKILGELPPVTNYLGIESNHNLKKLPNVIPHSYAQLRGISATGKGTRVALLMNVLMENFGWELMYGDNIPNYHALSKEEKKAGVEPPRSTHYIGIRFPELNLVILGARIVKSNKSRLLSLTGADGITAGLSHDTLFEILSKYKDMNVLYEGYTGLDSSYLDIKYQVEHNAHSRFFMHFYQHCDKQEMLDRFKSRSFKVAKGDAAYSQNENHGIHSYNLNKQQLEDLQDDIDERSIVEFYDSKEEPEVFVRQYLEFLGLDPVLLDKFKEKYPNFNPKRDYVDAKQNYNTYFYLWKFLDQEFDKCKEKFQK